MKKLFWTVLFFGVCQFLAAQTVKDTLIVGYTEAPPFIIEKEASFEGLNIWLWKQVAADLEIDYRLKKMKFSDMLEALKQGTIDVSINPLTITSERSKEMDFTHSYFASNSTIAIQKSTFLQNLFQFFRSVINLNFLRAFFVLMFIVFLFGFITWYFEKKVNPEQFRPGLKGIWDGLWWSAVTMTTVGYGDKAPKSKTGKMIALIWMLTGLLFISGLTASVASMLTVNQLKSNPEGFYEFKERSVGCIKYSSTSKFLTEHFFKDIQLYKDIQLGLKDLSDRKIEAFLYDEPILKYRIAQNEAFDNLILLPTKFDLQFYAFALPKDKIELRESISQSILELIESMEWAVILNEYNLSEI